MALKNDLTKLDKKALIEILADLYKKNKQVKEYLDFYFKPDEDGLFEKYQAKVYETFYPKRGFGYNLKQGKQYISEFKKLEASAALLAALMLFYVQTGIQFTNDYGDIDETFYNSLSSTYASALKLLKKEDLLDQFEERAFQLLLDSKNIGWGLNDSLSYTFYNFY
ncbi:DUF6155 family protein [Mucilaginibacter sp. AW1-7]|uniref:DUF6155 family protein n=1 Tax=unclassified Mucilaginibacter TaxID=2617802 RepID=UPI0008B0E646|nr:MULTISPECIES: DUF6155 family protein [unclassified Mucilaginibacter]WDF76343.1 DUF6155 family protein [Mucilaginibacter sp. KACC 22773]SEP42455.1 hypothetical protein SAMN05428947_11662 [Mucilaginibacter sp. OK283]